MSAKRILVRGRVQGVGFRAYASQQAWNLSISGEVWNRLDGCVEIIAAHEEEGVLVSFAELIQKGPGLIETVSVEEHQHPVPTGFQIAATR